MNKNVYITEKIFRSVSLIFVGAVFSLAVAYVSSELPQNTVESSMQASLVQVPLAITTEEAQPVFENFSMTVATDDLAINLRRD